MKHKRLRISTIAFLLLFSTLLTACGQGTGSLSDTTAPADATETEDGRLPSTLPADLRFDGTDINIWYFAPAVDAATTSEIFIDLAGDIEGDSVSAAIYAANMAVEDQLGVTLNFTNADTTSGEVGTMVRTQIMSDSTDFDLYSVIQWNSAALAAENLFLDIADEPYLALEQPWWSQSYMKELSVGDTMYFLAGDITLDMIRCNAAMYYNKRVYSELYGDEDALYQTVLDGDWTYERLTTCMEEAYVDLNNDSKVNVGDRLGLMANNFNNVDAFTFGAGARTVIRDSDGVLSIVVQDEHNVEIYDATYALYYQSPGMLIENTDTTIPQFSEGNSLFFAGFLYTSESLRGMSDNYGIIPYPKYDAAQSNYISVVHNLATLMCLPTNCEKVEAVTATLEALAYRNYYEVTPEYYGTALKGRYIRDSQSGEMVDIIHNTAMTDFGYVYEGSLNAVGLIMRLLIMEKGTGYASRAKGMNRSAEKALNTFIESFEKES